MTLARIVDGFLTYLSDIMALILRTGREEVFELLDEKVPLNLVLQRLSVEELLSQVAEVRIQRLSSAGWRNLSDEFRKNLGFPLFRDRTQNDLATLYIALRNAIVHNYGRADEGFVCQVPNTFAAGFSSTIGEPIALDSDVVETAVESVALWVRNIDLRAADKFGQARSMATLDRT